jgi:non-ribosomal peptide synthase protein (TIGR01720 family)
VVVSAGARFAALPNASFEIRPGHAGDYRDLVRHLAGADSRPRRFVHAWTAERAGTKAGDLKEQGFYSLLFLVQALGSELSGEPAEILVVTSGAQQVTGAESLEPEAAMAVAHCRVIPLEYPNVRCTAIDVDTNSAVSAGRDAELIVREACAPGDAVVALRGGRRWVQTFRPVTLDVPADAPHRLRQRGVYVVTGGTGGVGLALARYLARTVNARLVLIARTGLPPRERWSEWVGEYGADDAVSRVIAEVRDLEALGAEVLPVAADVADEAQMQQALEAAIARFGVLHGVLHAAGAEKLPRAIQELERGQCELQFRSRLEALPVLERVTRERPLDFVALSSSLSSVLGAAGFAPYTAAHVFMDAFAARRNSAGGTPWIAIDWDNWITWKSAPAQRDAADLRMTTEEGGEAFGRILACETATHVVVSTAPLDARREQIARGSARPARETVAAASLHARPALSSSYTAPRTDAERVLAGIWQDLLGVGEIGINDNFFELGGDSVTGIQVVARASAAGLRITTRQALEHQTIAELAAVASVATASVDHAPDGQGDVPLTPIQQWFFEQSPPEPNHFNQAVLLEVDRHLETSVLEEVADALARAHDVLRYRYVRGNDGWKQIAESVGAIAVRRVDLSSVPADRWSHAIEEAADHAQRGIDITNGPLMSVTFMDGGRTRAARLLLVAHHLIVDAVSWRVLLEDLYRGCEQRWSGTPIDLPRPGVSFQTWARRLAAYGQSVELAQEADFWLDQAAAAGTAVPVDFAGGSNTFAAAVRLDRALAADETTTLIHETCAHYRAQMPELLLTAVQQSLAEWMGGTAALVDVEGHGREDVVDAADIARTVGWFTTISPVVLGGAVPASPVEALKSVKERVRAIPHGGIGYGALRYLAADARNSERLRAMPHPEVSFLYLGRLDMAASTGWMRAASENAGVTRGAANVRRHVIDISVAISSGGLKVTWTYSEALHRRSTIDALADRFMRVLRDLIEAARSGHHEGYTPADFPAARLEQQDLDRLLATIKTGGTNQR